MKITKVTMDVHDSREAADFYGAVLGLPVTSAASSVTVSVGRTVLVLNENTETTGCHHLAFTIPANMFDAAKTWVSARAEIMSKGGEDEFEYDAGWNARSLYFPGPDGSVLEFIIRRDLNNAAEGDFTAADIQCISEVGVAVPDVLETVALLEADAGIEPYGLVPRDRFAPVGTINGLIILVTPDRAWFPADDLMSAQSRLQITATDARPGVYPLGELATLTVSA
jgi:catechol 2,3-dioxygenase-like lactoylglutathione lyase family enzyme